MAFDAYLKIPTIDGESTTKGYEKYIELMEYKHVVAQHSGGSMSQSGGLSGGRVDHGNFVVKHAMDMATPKLYLSCCKGEHIPNITIDLLRSTGEGKGTRFMQYKMTDVIISGVTNVGTTKGLEALPLEEIQFAYGKIEWTFTPVGADGKKKGDVKTGWSVIQNAAV
jgi:type VI secretion system secreted protein Hcp